jgi:uncharacterized protein (TIGR03083 family)
MDETPVQPVGKIETVELFPGLSRNLVEVLRSLSASEWGAPTVCGPWTVKDVAAHLLGGSLGRLWLPEEKTAAGKGAALSFAELLALINDKNDDWVQSARRISPHMLVDLLEMTDKRLYRHFKTLDENAPASANVAWAGEERSANWFDAAREYTEKWLHQQHIRAAVGRPLLVSRKWLYPVLDTFLRALPYTYREVDAGEGAVLVVRIRGRAGGSWSLRRERQGWQLYAGADRAALARVELDADLAWRLFTKGIAAAMAEQSARVRGDQALGRVLFEMVSIMA